MFSQPKLIPDEDPDEEDEDMRKSKLPVSLQGCSMESLDWRVSEIFEGQAQNGVISKLAFGFSAFL